MNKKYFNHKIVKEEKKYFDHKTNHNKSLSANSYC